MDLFRKHKKKGSQLHNGSSDATTVVTEGMAQMVIAETTDSFDNHNCSSIDEGESSASAIDALIDSDEDGAEIFNDSDEDDDDMPPETPTSAHSSLSNAASGAFQDVMASLDSAVGGGGRHSEDDDDDDEDDEEDDEDNDKSQNSDSAEDYTDDEDEGEDGYKPGGYHPVKAGEVYNQRCVFFPCLRGPL